MWLLSAIKSSKLNMLKAYKIIIDIPQFYDIRYRRFHVNALAHIVVGHVSLPTSYSESIGFAYADEDMFSLASCDLIVSAWSWANQH